MIQDIEFTQKYKWYLSPRLFFGKLGMFIINAEFLLENFKNVNLKINVIYNNVYQNP